MDVDDQRACWEGSYAASPRQWRGPPSLSPLEGEDVLELGCGNGKSAQALTAARVVALDFALPALRACREMLPSLSPVLADARSLPFTDRSFDVVIASHVLEHGLLEDRRRMAGEAFRVLRQGGRLLVRAFSVRDMRSTKGREVERGTVVRGNGIVYHYFEEGEMVGLFPDAHVISSREVVEERRLGKGRGTRAVLEVVMER